MAETFESVFRSVLSSHAGTIALVGSRIYPVVAPEDATKPFVVYTITDNVQLPVLSGNSGTYEARAEVACIASTYAKAHELATQAYAALDAVTSSGDSIKIYSANRTKQTDDVDDPSAGEEPTYLVIQEYNVWHD